MDRQAGIHAVRQEEGKEAVRQKKGRRGQQADKRDPDLHPSIASFTLAVKSLFILDNLYSPYPAAAAACDAVLH